MPKATVTKYITGHALKRLIKYGPTAKYYMGFEERGPDYIYDIAYSANEVKRIGQAVSKGMKIETSDVSFGSLGVSTSASLYYVATSISKHYKHRLDDGKFYTIEYEASEGEQKETLKEWALRVKGREPKDLDEKLQWYVEYGGRTKE